MRIKIRSRTPNIIMYQNKWFNTMSQTRKMVFFMTFSITQASQSNGTLQLLRDGKIRFKYPNEE